MRMCFFNRRDSPHEILILTLAFLGHRYYYNNFNMDIVANSDFDDDGYERLLERNEHYNKTIREK